ncbi:Ankyrin repeat-containing protein [Quillaja saponaria]|uniref:Ankyrin repeat-containing protein n=1 Tax=Quillaja saponaria TaxID=32244 RepID=A0AAD7LRT9_QUISA|nr:Ankyrin repeat-containing protein [Quillaja saponaria]
MDPRLLEAIRKNDAPSFLSLVEEDEGNLQQKTADSLNTALHLASKFVHLEMVAEIVKLCPDMVAAENKNLETPFHEACRGGNVKVLTLLLEVNPSAASKLNSNGKSCFFVACSHGHLDAVNLLLNQPGLVSLGEAGTDQTCIHVAASKGHTDVVRELLNACLELAQVTDENGNSPLHYACNEGHRDIAWMLLRRDANLALQYNNNGYTPLHLAVKNGKVSVLEDVVLSVAASLHYLTREEETIFHLAVRYGQYDGLRLLVHVSIGTNLLHCQDRYGSTALHLAVTGGRHKIAEYLINKTKLEINTRNSEGLTALDILDQAKDSEENRHLEATFVKAGGKRSLQFLSRSLEVSGAKTRFPITSKDSLLHSYMENELDSSIEMVSLTTSPPGVSKSTLSRISSLHHQAAERYDNETYKPESFSPTNFQQHRHLSKRHRKNLEKLYNNRRIKQHEMYTEALQNARNTIILVSILIATVTFSAGISPPGGVYQDGPMKGKSMAGKTTAFKVFSVSNDIALFISLSIVIVLVSIIPFQRKPQMRLLVIAHKVMWIAVAFMAVGYVAAKWVIMPHGHGAQWLSVVLLAVGGGSLGTIFIGLGVMLFEHWLRKLKWRKRRKERDGDHEKDSQNSDVESSYLQGYHSY